MFQVRDREIRKLLLATALLALAAAPALAASRRSSDMRRGAGVRVGTWEVHNLVSSPSSRSWESVAVEGWMQRGVDQQRVVENTLGFWQRNHSYSVPGSPGTQIDTDAEIYLVPMLSSVKFYPMSRGNSQLEPYLLGGGGLVMGIDRTKVTSTDPLVPNSDDMQYRAGLGITTGAGLEWNPPGQFGLTVGARYQWASFKEQVGGMGLYRGPGLNAGLTYRFQQ